MYGLIALIGLYFATKKRDSDKPTNGGTSDVGNDSNDVDVMNPNLPQASRMNPNLPKASTQPVKTPTLEKASTLPSDSGSGLFEMVY